MKRLIGKLIPKAWHPAIVRLQTALTVQVLRLFAISRWTSSLYFAFFSGQFGREHHAVLLGRLAYYRSLADMHRSSALLRRNVHRLEKGLIMRPRRAVFAEHYIDETVRCFTRAAAVSGFSALELKWARDVLDRYFEVAGDSPVIAAARTLYESAPGDQVPDTPDGERPSRPYPLTDAPATDITYEQIYTLFQRRRSVRWYAERPVPQELIEKIVEAAAYAPSACNRQPFRFVVSDSPARAVEVAQCAGGTVGFAENLQCVFAVVGDLSAYPSERDRHLIYIDGALASMQLMLSAETLGLSSCPINWPDVAEAERKISALLGLPGHERVVMLIAVGYGDPVGEIPFSQKKPPADLITYRSDGSR